MSGGTAAKRRNPQACDFCARRSTKCTPSAAQPGVCSACERFNEECKYERPRKKRGPRPKQSESLSSMPDEIITMLCDNYNETIYPIFPYFHWPSLQRLLLETPRSSAFQACLMALCAVSAARLRDNALPDLTARREAIKDGPSAEDFAEASEAAFPAQLRDCNHFGFLRASVLLAIAAIHFADGKRFQQYLGQAITLLSINKWTREDQWPVMSIIEQEELRRVVRTLQSSEPAPNRVQLWSLYTLEVYASVTFDNMLRLREAQCQLSMLLTDSAETLAGLVAYPAELDDEVLGQEITTTPQRSFLHGWNRTTDLYRLLEHTLYAPGMHRKAGSVAPPPILFNRASGPADADAILLAIDQTQAALPPEFKRVQPWTGNRVLDRYSFQAANLAATAMTCRVAALSLDTARLEGHLTTIESAIRDLANMPIEYLQSISAPFCHHVAGIGYLLANSMEPDLPTKTESVYLRARGVLEILAQLLLKLETGIKISPGTAAAVKGHIAQIDEAIAACSLPSGPALLDIFPFWPQDIIVPDYLDTLRAF